MLSWGRREHTHTIFHNQTETDRNIKKSIDVFTQFLVTDVMMERCGHSHSCVYVSLN